MSKGGKIAILLCSIVLAATSGVVWFQHEQYEQDRQWCRDHNALPVRVDRYVYVLCVDDNGLITIPPHTHAMIHGAKR
jgi:hypothetical protein